MSVVINNGVYNPTLGEVYYEVQLSEARPTPPGPGPFPPGPYPPGPMPPVPPRPIPGPQGPQGIQGPQGPKGEHGHMGLTGPQGPRGYGMFIIGNLDSIADLPTKANYGDAYMINGVIWEYVGIGKGDVTTPGDAWINVGTLSGAQGPQGPKGEQGIQGATGIQGPLGPQGSTGPQGLQGEQGIQGPTGIQGVQGETGPQGTQGIQGPMGPEAPVLSQLDPYSFREVQDKIMYVGRDNLEIDPILSTRNTLVIKDPAYDESTPECRIPSYPHVIYLEKVIEGNNTYWMRKEVEVRYTANGMVIINTNNQVPQEGDYKVIFR